MRITLTTITLGAALAIGTVACKKTDREKAEEMGVATKPVETADEAANDVRKDDLSGAGDVKDEVKEAANEIGEANKEVRDETREAQKEMAEAFSTLRGQLKDFQVDATTFVANRDKVAGDVRMALDRMDQQIARLSAKMAGMPTGPKQEVDQSLADAKKVAIEARAESDALAAATAESWPKARDEALDSLSRLNDEIAEAAAKIYTE
jgi:methyl-accepting chemotaxis protein